MTNVYINLNNNPDDQYGKFELSIDPNKEGKAKFLELSIQEKIGAYLFAFMHLELEHLQDDIEMSQTIFSADTAIQHVKNLRALFRALKEEDLSKDIGYALKLSKSWHGLTQYQDSATSKELKTEAHIKIGKFIELFYHYPTADEHALGFYLKEYAGENWLPFPFMKILADLHQDYVSNQERSPLSKMIRLLTNIIESFRF